MNFLREYNNIIDIRERQVSISDNLPREPLTDQYHLPLPFVDDDVSTSPHSCAFVPKAFGDPYIADGVAELRAALFFNQGASIAIGLLHLSRGRTILLLTNVFSERQLVTKEIQQAYSKLT